MLSCCLRRISPIAGRFGSFCEKFSSEKLSNASHLRINFLRYDKSSSWPFTLAARSMSTKNFDLNYKDLLEVKDKENVVVIDVRNPDEVREGSIPGSTNIPLSELEAALQLDESNFKKMYGMSKPTKDIQMVFSCRSGNRSRRALELAQKLGFENSVHYVGGWLDWVEQTK
ncbi:hypothetical protein J437_LFUL007111 [Ladona fulva]|uniref:Rhodanese domain-containing protein n=1 Tax=Ladona fulva TaxID=123851 RepID=A0A8K0NW85_LADFU|nr:hypothetical protein J437_LFUL007111 [Ladona fulva]